MKEYYIQRWNVGTSSFVPVTHREGNSPGEALAAYLKVFDSHEPATYLVVSDLDSRIGNSHMFEVTTTTSFKVEKTSP